MKWKHNYRKTNFMETDWNNYDKVEGMQQKWDKFLIMKKM